MRVGKPSRRAIQPPKNAVSSAIVLVASKSKSLCLQPPFTKQIHSSHGALCKTFIRFRVSI